MTDPLDPIPARVKTIVAETLGVDLDLLTPGVRFDDPNIGADSLDLVELTMSLEEEFEIEIPDVDADRIHTVQETIDYIERRIA